jgi:hypothetical protein
MGYNDISKEQGKRNMAKRIYSIGIIVSACTLTSQASINMNQAQQIAFNNPPLVQQRLGRRRSGYGTGMEARKSAAIKSRRDVALFIMHPSKYINYPIGLYVPHWAVIQSGPMRRLAFRLSKLDIDGVAPITRDELRVFAAVQWWLNTNIEKLAPHIGDVFQELNITPNERQASVRSTPLFPSIESMFPDIELMQLD